MSTQNCINSLQVNYLRSFGHRDRGTRLNSNYIWSLPVRSGSKVDFLEIIIAESSLGGVRVGLEWKHYHMAAFTAQISGKKILDLAEVAKLIVDGFNDTANYHRGIDFFIKCGDFCQIIKRPILRSKPLSVDEQFFSGETFELRLEAVINALESSLK
ncbi:MAG: hypothetical protein NT141_00975 [candidate division WWE3 bacterium]|nr:hypothetical protein [candidate division WWE3 bacterium]